MQILHFQVGKRKGIGRVAFRTDSRHQLDGKTVVGPATVVHQPVRFDVSDHQIGVGGGADGSEQRGGNEIFQNERSDGISGVVRPLRLQGDRMIGNCGNGNKDSIAL